MKKISIFSTLLAGVVAFSACTPEIEPALPPVSYEPVDPAQVAINITADQYAQAIDLINYEGDSIAAFTIDLSATPALSEGTTLEYTLAMAATEDMASAQTLPVTVEGNIAKVAVADLNAKIQTIFGKRPQPDTFYSRLGAMVKDADGRNFELISNVIAATATPIATPIESAYYLIGDVNGWDFTAAANMPFSHSGKDVYEDPIFTILITVDGEKNWKVAPQSAIDSGKWDTVLGNTEADGSASTTGNLADNASAAGAMKFPEAGHYKVTLNMEAYTYTVEVMPDVIEYFVVGDFSGWSQTNGQRLYSVAGAPAQGWLVLDGKGGNGWKISTQEDWNGTNYGAGEAAAAEAASMLLSTDGGADNITQYAGFSYEVLFDASNLTLTILRTADSWGLVGSFNEWGGSADIPMTLSTEDGMDYLVATATWDAGVEFKVRANSDWAINYGDAGAGNGTVADGGANLKIEEAGEYEVRYYFCAQEPYITVTKR